MKQLAHVVWEPGNSTRYECAVYRLDQPLFHHPAGTLLVLGPYDRPKAMFLNGDGRFLSHIDTMDKMHLSEHDAAFVTEMVARALGWDFTTAEFRRSGTFHEFDLTEASRKARAQP